MVDDKVTRGIFFNRLRSFSLSTVIVLALSLAIAWPLWAFATHNRRLFTEAIGLALALLTVVFVSLAVCRRIARRRLSRHRTV
jgi:type VI protein secretion system component VasK